MSGKHASDVFLTTSQAAVGVREVTLRKLGGGRVEIMLNGYGLGHVQTAYAATIFPEVKDWLTPLETFYDQDGKEVWPG